jgi:aspartate aminotransferase
MEFSRNIQNLRPSATIAVSTLARKLRSEGRDVINLSAGEPDFPTPEWISDAAVESIRQGHTGYTPAPGLPELRTAIAKHLQGRSQAGWEIDPSQVVVSAGAKQSLFNACFTLFGPGDEVLIASPYWTSYPQIVGLAQATPRFVAGPEERGFRLTAADLEAVVTDRTRGFILCSPSNPTGTVYSREELAEVAAWAKARDIVLISDEIYRWIYFGEEGATAAGILDLDAAALGPHVVIDGVSKSYAMTGWRIGYAVAAAEVAGKMSALQSHTTSNPSAPAQYAALAALTQEERARGEIREMVKAFRRRRDLVVDRIRERLPHLSLVEPNGAFYVFVRVDSEFDETVGDSQAWCSKVLEETGVAMVPGAAFGDDRFVRLSYATSDEVLEEAVRRLAEDRSR